MEKDKRLENAVIHFGDKEIINITLSSRLIKAIDAIKIHYDQVHPMTNKLILQQEKARKEEYYAIIRKTTGREKVC